MKVMTKLYHYIEQQWQQWTCLMHKHQSVSAFTFGVWNQKGAWSASPKKFPFGYSIWGISLNCDSC